MSRRMGWALLASATAGFVLFGCGGDEPPSADFTVEVQTARFFPNSLSVPVGSTVRWVNVNPRDSVRTVTSGSGPADTAAGIVFDQTLRGYSPGSAEGEDFIFQFEDRGDYPYFSRIPPGREFLGFIVVQ